MLAARRRPASRSCSTAPLAGVTPPSGVSLTCRWYPTPSADRPSWIGQPRLEYRRRDTPRRYLPESTVRSAVDALVRVVAPEPGIVTLVPTEWSAVEPLPMVHSASRPLAYAGVRVEDGLTFPGEGAHAWALQGKAVRIELPALEWPETVRAFLGHGLFGERDAEVEVDVEVGPIRWCESRWTDPPPVPSMVPTVLCHRHGLPRVRCDKRLGAGILAFRGSVCTEVAMSTNDQVVISDDGERPENAVDTCY